MDLLDVFHIQTLCYAGDTEVSKIQSHLSQGLLSGWGETGDKSYKVNKCSDIRRIGWRPMEGVALGISVLLCALAVI